MCIAFQRASCNLNLLLGLHTQWESTNISWPSFAYLELGLVLKSHWCFPVYFLEEPSFPWFSPPLHPSLPLFRGFPRTRAQRPTECPGGERVWEPEAPTLTRALGAGALEGTGWGRPCGHPSLEMGPELQGGDGASLPVGEGCSDTRAGVSRLTNLPLHSGLTHEAHRKEVEQVYLRCSAGTVEWMYPTGALIVNLRPNTFSPSRHLTLCIKPLRGSSGANIYLEKTGELKLLVRDGDLGPGQAPCFSFEQGGLFVEATPQQDISRRTTGFQYELTSRHAGPDLHTLSGECGAQGGVVASGVLSRLPDPPIISHPHLSTVPEHAARVRASGLAGLPEGGRGALPGAGAPLVLWAVWTWDDGHRSEQSCDTVLAHNMLFSPGPVLTEI